MITEEEISLFISDGYLRIDNVFSAELAGEARDVLWREMKLDPSDSGSWTKPVIRLGDHSEEPFQKIASAPKLHEAFDQLVGKGKWLKRMSLGSFPIRFPGGVDPGDTGWHVDSSFPGADPGDYMTWRINVTSRGRALLMLFLLSDVEEYDAPTRIRVGSHVDVARVLAPAGANGMSFFELAGQLSCTENRREVVAVGKAGTVYLCHPFLVHAAQIHKGQVPKFMAQPPLQQSGEFDIHNKKGSFSPVEVSIRKALQLE